jgi:hypothetical protein
VNEFWLKILVDIPTKLEEKFGRHFRWLFIYILISVAEIKEESTLKAACTAKLNSKISAFWYSI